MSTVSEMAEAEADEVEAAEAQEETEAEEQAEPEPETQVQAPPVDPEKVFKALDNEASRHVKRVAEITGAEFELLHACPGCADFTPGFTLVPPVELASRKESPYTRRCETCDGFGELETGARAETRPEFERCPDCAGNGFTRLGGPLPDLGAPAPSYPGADVPHTPVEGGDNDAWGRPAGHPHWGVLPSAIT